MPRSNLLLALEVFDEFWKKQRGNCEKCLMGDPIEIARDLDRIYVHSRSPILQRAYIFNSGIGSVSELVTSKTAAKRFRRRCVYNSLWIGTLWRWFGFWNCYDCFEQGYRHLPFRCWWVIILLEFGTLTRARLFFDNPHCCHINVIGKSFTPRTLWGSMLSKYHSNGRLHRRDSSSRSSWYSPQRERERERSVSNSSRVSRTPRKRHHDPRRSSPYHPRRSDNSPLDDYLVYDTPRSPSPLDNKKGQCRAAMVNRSAAMHATHALPLQTPPSRPS